ncbi:hypothetical protein JR904_03785 [Enterobacter roggenkampii]|uniref:DUF6351 family protein n=1 Tax=Enterobacter roggenkampii TaxID=1812935 RepID=UPI001A8DB068|nr:DUF6351 family protein [Enterobacter roggenkampii]MBN9702745.1 hypothetical protein [Enterobacter roggenkampii]HBT5887355.1 hypothetical protein [Klebsiella quasipneumoniae]HCI6316355.1 hypothetical protein [Klebsiella quasipneumoniae subsp. similipneumoniae]
MQISYLASSVVLVGVGVVLTLGACGGSNTSSIVATPQGTLSSFSPRSNAVVGSEALLQLSGVDSPGSLTIAVNGANVDAQFRSDAEGRMLALVPSLRSGANSVEVTQSGRSVAKLELESYPTSGPIFSGPHQQPWICQTNSFVLPDGTKLPASNSPDCAVATVVQYVYVDESGAVKPLGKTNSTPPDVAKTTTSTGSSVNFIVRVETGTINRGIYQTAILHDPVKDSPLTPFTRPAGWNGEVVYPFGGGCNPGYRQATALGGTYKTSLYELSKGYAVASSTLNVWANNCNSTLSAETAMMVKERLVEVYGVPRAVIGKGGSGGAKSQFMIADNYPGILDGILPGIQAGGPDGITANPSTVDCSLLVNYFNEKATHSWTYAQKTAVAGWAGWNNCEKQAADPVSARPWHTNYSPYYMQPTSHMPQNFIGCNADVIPVGLLYHPTSNPTGARCDLYSNQINIFGGSASNPRLVRRPMDSVGIQYGLIAFNESMISVDQFIELNEKIGGYDEDGNYVRPRTVADVDALRIAYQTGQVLNGGGGLAATPIIDLRMYYEATPDLHDRLGSFITRERLIAANGNAENMVMFTYPLNLPTGPYGSNIVESEALSQMSAWLAKIRADRTIESASAKVRRNKPANAIDTCWDNSGKRIAEKAVFSGPTQCNALYPAHKNPRLAAGMPLKHDVLKCQLKPVDVSDYAQAMTPAQVARLKQTFHDGVCDFSKPGIEQQGLAGSWFGFPSPGAPSVFGS